MADDSEMEEEERGKVRGVLLTQREDTNDSSIGQNNIKSPESQNMSQIQDEAKVEAEKVVEKSIEIVGHEQQQPAEDIREQLQQLTDRQARGDVEEVEDSVFDYKTDSYIEPVPDPYNKAIGYLEQHNIMQLFQGLTSTLVFNRPEDPLASMMEQLQVIKLSRPQPKQTSQASVS